MYSNPMLMMLLSATPVLASIPTYPVLVEMFSDAQCPCSAQFVSDINKTLGEFEGTVDFNQYFVSGSFTSNKPAPNKCIHGEAECLGQRYFLCARGDWGNESTYRTNKRFVDFQMCAYGPCTGCAAILGAQCPCRTYSNFTTVSNGILEGCAKEQGLDWSALQSCATPKDASGAGEMMFEAASQYAYSQGVFYGEQGLPVVHVNGEHVKTKSLIPITCGPTPKEVKKAICSALTAKGVTPLPAACA